MLYPGAHSSDRSAPAAVGRTGRVATDDGEKMTRSAEEILDNVVWLIDQFAGDDSEAVQNLPVLEVAKYVSLARRHTGLDILKRRLKEQQLIAALPSSGGARSPRMAAHSLKDLGS
jgi:hypothetical protein